MDFLNFFFVFVLTLQLNLEGFFGPLCGGGGVTLARGDQGQGSINGHSSLGVRGDSVGDGGRGGCVGGGVLTH